MLRLTNFKHRASFMSYGSNEAVAANEKSEAFEAHTLRLKVLLQQYYQSVDPITVPSALQETCFPFRLKAGNQAPSNFHCMEVKNTALHWLPRYRLISWIVPVRFLPPRKPVPQSRARQKTKTGIEIQFLCPPVAHSLEM